MFNHQLKEDLEKVDTAKAQEFKVGSVFIIYLFYCVQDPLQRKK